MLLSACGATEECNTADCALTDAERALLSGLAPLGAPARDASNHVIDNPMAIELGRQFFFDPGFSGPATQVDALDRPVPYAAGGKKKGEELQISCASCHDMHRAGADTRSVPNHISVGAGWSPVNARSIVNVAHYDLPFWNGREDSLWAMILPVVESKLAMNSNRMRVAWRIHDHYYEAYARIFPETALPFGELTRNSVKSVLAADGTCIEDASGCPEACERCGDVCYPKFPPDGKPGADPTCNRGAPKADGPWNDAFDCMSSCEAAPETTAMWRAEINKVFGNFSKVIAAYEAKLVSNESRFDRFMRGEATLNDAEIRGARLFVGKAACVDCHNTGLFSDNHYYNTGVPEVGDAVPTVAECYAGHASCDCAAGVNCLPFGRWDGAKRLAKSNYKRTGTWSDDRSDESRAQYYGEPSDDMKGAWRTPSLREVALTGPYMHNGSLKTLDEVVLFYDWGGSTQGSAPEHKSVKMRPLLLTAEDRSDLVAFLGTLTGDPLPESLVGAPTLPPLD